jgi:hypothetical protein
VLGFQDDAEVPINPDGLRQRGVQYVVTAPETRADSGRRNLSFVEADPQRYPLLARSGDINIYQVAP